MILNVSEIPYGTKTIQTLNWDKIKNKKALKVLPNSKRNKDNPFTNMRNLGWKMLKTCLIEDGIGLAAPQIGIFKQVILCKVFDEKVEDDFTVFKLYINPSFKAHFEEGQETKDEFCLSVPGKSFPITRYNSIELSWDEMSEDGALTKLNKKLVGLEARVIQHEIDHLLGISIPQRYHIQKKNK